MKPFSNSPGSAIADIIENRSPAGPNDSVQGWHNLLKKILLKMAPYLREDQLVTFRTMTDQEVAFFERIRREISIPPSVTSIYMPPSVLYQMMYNRPAAEPQPIPEHSQDNPPDEGIILACRKNDVKVVINTLLAKPPFTPAIDVYDDGQLLAGYTYNTIDECVGDLSKVLQVHLSQRANKQ